jgi:hypothetical protein
VSDTRSGDSALTKRPERRQVWKVRHLWLDSTDFGKCTEAQKRLRVLHGIPDGFACVPYKTRPAIVIAPAEDNRDYYFVLTTTSKPGDTPPRVPIGRLGALTDPCFVFVQRPLRYHHRFFTEHHGEMSQEDYALCVKEVERRVALRCLPAEKTDTDPFTEVFK